MWHCTVGATDFQQEVFQPNRSESGSQGHSAHQLIQRSKMASVVSLACNLSFTHNYFTPSSAHYRY